VEVVCHISPPPSGREWIVAGTGRLVHRAIENVMRNAIRFSRRGQQIEITLDGNGKEYRLAVMDNGPGVAEEFLPSFFEPFAKRSATDDHSGVGLGLSIAKRAIVANQGTISVSNRPTGGLMIVIALPAAANQAAMELAHS
jgi:two-component system OmpR family sensor kinase